MLIGFEIIGFCCFLFVFNEAVSSFGWLQFNFWAFHVFLLLSSLRNWLRQLVIFLCFAHWIFYRAQVQCIYNCASNRILIRNACKGQRIWGERPQNGCFNRCSDSIRKFKSIWMSICYFLFHIFTFRRLTTRFQLFSDVTTLTNANISWCHVHSTIQSANGT